MSKKISSEFDEAKVKHALNVYGKLTVVEQSMFQLYQKQFTKKLKKGGKR